MTEAYVPADVVSTVLRAAGQLVLVGGQALAFWMDRYDVSVDLEHYPAVTRDIDFLTAAPTDAHEVVRLAKVLGGHALIPRQSAITALVGQAVRDLGDGAHLNVDVIFRVYGADASAVIGRALEVTFDDVAIRVMHPMDVLKSRLDNLHGIASKQTRIGELQLIAAIAVARCAQREIHEAQGALGARVALSAWVRFIQGLAKSSAGRKIAQRHHIFVADAVEPALVDDEQFVAKHLPALRELMSPARVKELQL